MQFTKPANLFFLLSDFLRSMYGLSGYTTLTATCIFFGIVHVHHLYWYLYFFACICAYQNHNSKRKKLISVRWPFKKAHIYTHCIIIIVCWLQICYSWPTLSQTERHFIWVFSSCHLGRLATTGIYM